jgi:hypothetical protein
VDFGSSIFKRAFSLHSLSSRGVIDQNKKIERKAREKAVAQFLSSNDRLSKTKTNVGTTSDKFADLWQPFSRELPISAHCFVASSSDSTRKATLNRPDDVCLKDF